MQEILCPNCGSKYNLTFQKINWRDKDSIDCEVCNFEIYAWNEAKIFSATLVESKTF